MQKPIVIDNYVNPFYALRKKGDETYMECLVPNGKGGFHIQHIRRQRLNDRWGVEVKR